MAPKVKSLFRITGRTRLEIGDVTSQISFLADVMEHPARYQSMSGDGAKPGRSIH